MEKVIEEPLSENFINSTSLGNSDALGIELEKTGRKQTSQNELWKHAVMHGAMLKVMAMKKFVDINAPIQINEHTSMPALHYLVGYRKNLFYYQCADLIEAGADCNASDSDNRTPLMRAAQCARSDNEYFRILGLLFEKTNLFQKDNMGGDILFCAAYAAHYDFIKLLQCHMPINTETVNMLGRSPLHELMRGTSEVHENAKILETARLLVSLGFKVDQQDSFGNTPLHLLVEATKNNDSPNQKVDVVLRLIDFLVFERADFGIKNNKGQTAVLVGNPGESFGLEMKIFVKLIDLCYKNST